ncbi:MAG: hypothetical protein Q9220_000755 [cf. Caloplaca sp. 1 TL-2023]
MTTYINNWWSNHSASCGGLGFSTCFLSLHELGTYDCTGVKPGACPAPDPTSENITAQDYYVLYNIYAVNQVFYSLYMAAGNANTLASETVGAIVKLINPVVKPKNMIIDDILAALTAGLGIMHPSHDFIGRLMRATQQSPGVGRALLPTGTVEAEVDQWASIANEVGTLVQQYQGIVASCIPLINNDITTFLIFTSTGAFSTMPLPDLSSESNLFIKALTTYIIGAALTANNFVITRAIDTDINALQLNTTDGLAFDPGCGHGYDEDGMCGPYWYDQNAHVTYALNNNGDGKSRTNYGPLLKTMFGNWTTGDLIFGGAARCAASGGPHGSLAQTVVAADGTITLDCLSMVKICTWDVNSMEADHEYTDCPSQSGFAVDGCSGRCGDSEGTMFDVNVPNAYIGGFIQAGGNYCVCND